MKMIFRKMSMRKRMILFFSIPPILLLFLLLMLFYPKILDKYKQQVQYSFQQSVSQAVSFLENYVQNMTYLGEMIENNGEVQEILSSDTFRENRNYDSQYDEFYRLNKEFGRFEFDNSIYRFVLYVPDSLVYSTNSYYFYGESRLEEREDYERMLENFKRGKDYLEYSEERKELSNFDTVDMLTLYHRILSKNTQQQIGVCSVSIPLDEFINVMENANITHDGLVYLQNDRGNMIVTSNQELYERIAEQSSFPGSGEEWTFQNIILGESKYYCSRQNVGAGGWQMISLISREEYEGQYRIIAILLVAFAVIIALVIAIIATILSGYYVGRLTRLRNEMTDLQGGNLNVQLPVGAEGDEIEAVYRDFNFMVNEVQRLMQEHYQLGKNVKMAEIRALQAQINPHFLYNTLDLINWIAMDYGASDIEKIAWNLARYYRLSLNHGKSVISIEEEVEHTQVYVNIENYHFDNAIQMTVDIPEDLKHKACLNIILQPFVENAIVHGIAENSAISQCRIHVTAQRQEDDILFRIQDDGPGMTEEQIHDAVSVDMAQSGKGYGVKNINFRIKLCFGEKYGVQYKSQPGHGTTAMIRIPVMTIDEAEERMV